LAAVVAMTDDADYPGGGADAADRITHDGTRAIGTGS
jgi:hypothetical protein